MTMPLDEWGGSDIWTWRTDDEAEDAMAGRVKRAKAEGDTYDTYREELGLAKLLGQAVARAGVIALKEYDKITGLEGPKVTARRTNDSRILAELDKLDTVMRGAWTPSVDKAVSSYIGYIVNAGNKRAGGFAGFAKLPTRPLVEAGMVASAKYFTNNHFNRIIMPSITGDILNKIQTGEGLDDTFFRAMRAKLATRLKSVPYWRLVANQASSRAYHYGLTRAGLSLGYTGYRLDAVIDKATTPVCRALDGKVFWLADAVQRLEKLARVTPKDIAAEAPWLTLEDVDGKDSTQLSADGVQVPPFHANCRTTMSLVK